MPNVSHVSLLAAELDAQLAAQRKSKGGRQSRFSAACLEEEQRDNQLGDLQALELATHLDASRTTTQE